MAKKSFMVNSLWSNKLQLWYVNRYREWEMCVAVRTLWYSLKIMRFFAHIFHRKFSILFRSYHKSESFLEACKLERFCYVLFCFVFVFVFVFSKIKKVLIKKRKETKKFWNQRGFKGALDKYKIYLFISNSIEYFKLNQYRNFQLILPMHFHFMRYFVNTIILRVSHRLLYCVFIEVDFEK